MKLTITLILLFIQRAVLANSIHPVSITWANADIQDHKVSLSVKTTAEDLLYFHPLSPDSLFRLSQAALMDAARQHSTIIKSGFFILDQNKDRLPVTIVSSNFNSLKSKKEFDVMELLKYPLYYKMEFELADNIDLLVFHQALSESGLPSVCLLSISKNTNSLVQNIELSEHQPFSIGRDAVSIGSPSEVNFMLSYITLTDTEVLHELTLPMALLKTFVSIKDKEFNEAVKIIEGFIEENSTVEVNKSTIDPDAITLVFQNETEALMNDQSLVNIRVAYNLKSFPNEIGISWNSFNWKMRWFKSLIDAFGTQVEHNFSRFQPRFEMKREMKLKKEGN
ncbi:MAG: hypothetical protein ABJH04_02115 [Cyclobacteriaceae bacterium]